MSTRTICDFCGNRIVPKDGDRKAFRLVPIEMPFHTLSMGNEAHICENCVEKFRNLKKVKTMSRSNDIGIIVIWCVVAIVAIMFISSFL